MEYHALLGAEEERTLLEQASAGDADAVEKLVLHNQRMVYSVALRWFHYGFVGDIELEDLVQWGNIGLMRAIQKWDPGRGSKFSTYAMHWINGILWRYAPMQGLSIKTTCRENTKMGALRRAHIDLTNQLGRDPTADEIAAATGFTEAFVTNWLPALMKPISLDNEKYHVFDYLLYEVLPADSDDNPALAAERRIVLSQIHQAIQELPEQAREVITRRYLTNPPRSYSEISRKLGVSTFHVQRIEENALACLRKAINFSL